MHYDYLKTRGALNEAEAAAGQQTVMRRASLLNIADARRLLAQGIPPAVVECVPESVSRENRVMPLAVDGETLIFASARPGDIPLTDKLRFLLNRNVRLVAAPEEEILRAIDRH